MTTRQGGSWTLFLFLPHMSSYCVSITEQTTGKYNLFVNYTPRPLEFFNFILNFRWGTVYRRISSSHFKRCIIEVFWIVFLATYIYEHAQYKRNEHLSFWESNLSWRFIKFFLYLYYWWLIFYFLIVNNNEFSIFCRAIFNYAGCLKKRYENSTGCRAS